MSINNVFFNEFYLTIINNIFNNNIFNNNIFNKELLFLIENEFNILNHFSHYIKKYNIKVDIVISDYKFYDNMLQNLKGEECESFINLNLKIDKIENKKFNLVIFFQLESIDKLENILLFLEDKLYDDFKIYIYCSLLKKNKNNFFFKNIIREQIMNFTSHKLSYVLCYESFLNVFHKNNFYHIKSMKIFKQNEYIIYGINSVYEIILEKK